MKTILVIDDEASVRDAFSLALESLDVKVVTAENGEQGVELAKDHLPDLVFLDLNMPGIRGPEVLEQIKQFAPNMKLYIVTAFAKEFTSELTALRQEGYQFDVAAKPLSNQQICEIVSSNLTTEQYMAKEDLTLQCDINLRFYIAGHTQQVDHAVNKIKQSLKDIGIENVELDIIDILVSPEKTRNDDVFATPALVRTAPLPSVKLITNIEIQSDIQDLIKQILPPIGKVSS